MCVLDFVAKSGHQSDKSVLSLIHECVLLHVCSLVLLRASVGYCGCL